jgi:hypothetical protein
MAELRAEAGDVVVALAGHCPRHWLQSADVIVVLQDGIPAACRSALATLAACPGCAVVLVLPANGRWLVAARRVIGS